MLRYFILSFFMVLAFSSLAVAEPFVCFTSPVHLEADLFQTASWHPGCQAMERFSVGLKATSLVFSGAALGLACTGVGAPFSLWFQGGAVGTSVVDLIVGQLPCDNHTRDQDIQEMAELTVCKQLAQAGIACVKL